MNKIDLLKAVLAVTPDDVIEVFALQCKCKQELATEIFAGKTGKQSDKLRVSNTVKLLEYLSTHNSKYARVYRDSKGRQMVTNQGYNMIIFHDELPLAQWEPQEEQFIKPEVIDRKLALSKENRNKSVVINKKHIAYYKSFKKGYINIYGTLFYFDNLKRTVEVSGEIEIQLNTDKPLSPCYFKGENCEGAIVPCHPLKNGSKVDTVEYTEAA